MAEREPGVSTSKLVGFGALYFAQGIPLGIAAEYLPVALRQSHASYSLIAAVSWLQLPWALKVLWARAGDLPSVRAKARRLVLLLQLGLAAIVATYAAAPLASSRALWFTLTALAALFAATQDVLVDGLAVRSLGKEERGLGNVAQVGAYRLGMVFGGAGLLVLGAKLGERWAIVALAASIAVGSAGVVLIGEPRIGPDATPADTEAKGARRRSLADEIRLTGRTLASMLHRDVRAVLAVAFFYKLGLHTASTLLKPVLVDGGWSKERIGTLAVTVGTLAGVAGSMAGGLLHKKAGDRGGLTIAAVLQALACAPLFFVPGSTDETARVTVALAVEHAASGLGTTVLFAALMGATNPRHASLQYTVLSTANALSLAVAGALGAAIADVSSPRWSFALGAVLSLGSLALVPAFTGAARALHEGRELPP